MCVYVDGHRRVRGKGRAQEGSWVGTGTGGFVGMDTDGQNRGHIYSTIEEA